MATMQNPPSPFHPSLVPATDDIAVPLRVESTLQDVSGATPLEEVPATSFMERIAKRVGYPKLLLLLHKRNAINTELRSIPRRMQLITNQARLVLDLVDDFRSGSYRSVSWVSIAVAAACLVYAVSPGDIVPDVLPIVGAMDDMVVITVAMKFLEKDLRAYCRHKGYAEKDYFG